MIDAWVSHPPAQLASSESPLQPHDIKYMALSSLENRLFFDFLLSNRDMLIYICNDSQ
jgi:hypothetical protein